MFVDIDVKVTVCTSLAHKQGCNEHRSTNLREKNVCYPFQAARGRVVHVNLEEKKTPLKYLNPIFYLTWNDIKQKQSVW